MNESTVRPTAPLTMSNNPQNLYVGFNFYCNDCGKALEDIVEPHFRSRPQVAKEHGWAHGWNEDTMIFFCPDC